MRTVLGVKRHETLTTCHVLCIRPASFSLGHCNCSLQGGTISAVSTLLFILPHLITAFQVNTELCSSAHNIFGYFPKQCLTMTPATKSKRAAAAWQTCDGHQNICISCAFILGFSSHSTTSTFLLKSQKQNCKLRAF